MSHDFSGSASVQKCLNWINASKVNVTSGELTGKKYLKLSQNFIPFLSRL